jgi:ABC-type sugar transport system permease subunit
MPSDTPRALLPRELTRLLRLFLLANAIGAGVAVGIWLYAREIDLLTNGGPTPQDSTTTLTYLVYGSSSVARSDAGLQSGVAVLLFVVLLALSALQLRGLGRRVHYGNE